MDPKQFAPGTRSEHAGANFQFSESIDKGTQLSLTHAQRKVLNLLSDGGMYSAADISIQLRMCDPRGIIRDLRHSGVAISDVWVKGSLGVRFKRYFIHRGL